MAAVSDEQIREAIREILRNADLSALSSKTVRKKLEERFQTDLTIRKQEIDDMLMTFINAIGDEKKEDESGNDDDDEGTSNGKASASVSKNGSSKSKRARSSSASGTNSDSDGEFMKNNSNKAKASAKKQRGSNMQAKGGEASTSGDDVDDEAFARKLQQEELHRMRPRLSKQKVEKKPKATKAASAEGGGKKKGNSLYAQECVLSAELSAIMGTDRLARKDVVSRMWKIFKERDLMDPNNKQYVICDEQLEKVFKCKKFRAFSMMKFLKSHIKDAKLIQS